MRVIAGTARRLQLRAPEGMDTRPTTDRIKETLFNMISFDLNGALFVDLFSGSGAIGIEALSRGAAFAWFAEKNPAACACIRENLRRTGLESRAQVLMRDARLVLKELWELCGGRPADFIFMDPPYGRQLEREILTALSGLPLADGHTTIIVEADIREDFSYVGGLGFKIQREKKYKTNKHVFILKNES